MFLARLNMELIDDGFIYEEQATFDSVQWYCMAKKGATDIVLKEHIDGACAMRGVDCRKIEDGGPCGGKDYWFKASYALNTYCIYYAHVGAICEDFDIGNLTAVEPHISEDLNGIKPRDDVNCFLPPINMAKTSMKVGENPNVDPALNPKPTGTKGKGNKWCVSIPWAGEKELEVIQDNLCKNKLVKPEICEAMQDQPKRGPCFVRHKSRVSYAMNAYYQSKNGDERSCDFNGTGTIVDKDPSTSTSLFLFFFLNRFL